MFSRSNVVITGGQFWHTEPRVETAFEKLQKASAPSAFHDSSVRFDSPKCHPNTRVAVLVYLMEWILGRDDPDALILWLYGPAGAGKSAILQTIAERCFERKVLLASFFFGRSDSTRNTFKPFVATIAYQIAIAIPETKTIIANIIERDPLIFDKSVATQVQSLIVEPLKDLVASGFFKDPQNCARLVLIDALDECDDPQMQSMVLRVLATALRDQKVPLVFLIASRPEHHLTVTFNSPLLVGLWRSLVLDDSFQPNDDIRLFLQDSFQDIKSTHPHRHLIPEVWPEPSDVDELVWKSSGQFIYASMVVKYISVPLDRPPHRLEVVMGLRPARRDVPFAELDALYMHILDSCPDPETVLFVLGPVICGILGRVNEIELLMDVESGDVEVALAPLTSIINLVSDEFYGTDIIICHASFIDFLVDISRSGRFHINTVTIKENIVAKCLSILRDPYEWPKKLVDTSKCLEQSGYSTSPQAPIGWNLLNFIQSWLQSALYNSPLTETVENALKEFSLPRFWLYWSPKFGPYGVSVFRKMDFVSAFLKTLSGKDQTAKRKQIYAFHLSSFESIFKSEIRPYYQDIGLLSLVVITLFGEKPYAETALDHQMSYKSLFRLTEELMEFDHDTLDLAVVALYNLGARELLLDYRYLFQTGLRASAEFCLDDRKHAQTALRILEFLCDHPPHPIPYRNVPRKHQTPKPHSTRTGASKKLSHRFSPGKTRTQRLSDISLPRKRREEKHRHGVALSFRLPANSTEDLGITQEACNSGLSYLPGILRRSSNSPELVDFIRTHSKNIAFTPKWTRKAIRAMHEYLDRAEEDQDMYDLRKRFSAMNIGQAEDV